MTRMRMVGVALAGVVVVVALGAASASCSQTPTNVPVRTFEQAQKVDVVCMQVNDVNGNALPGPVPVVEAQCAPVPANVNGASLPFHLFAVVTQTTRGELAVVDLTAGNVVDEDRSTPGINFIPVGSIPTDVSVAPDGEMTFVASANPNKLAIFGIPSTRLLGDSLGSPPPPPLQLTDLVACALPQPPQALAIAPLATPDGGTPTGYAIIAMLRAWAGMPAKIVSLDPTALLQGAGIVGGGPGAAPGTLAPCAVLGATTLSGALPSTWSAGPTWPDGVPYADGGIDLRTAEPSPGPSCAWPTADSGAPAEAGASPDGGVPADSGAPDGAPAEGGSGDAGSAADAGDAGLPLSFGPLDDPHPTAMAMRSDGHVLYVADDTVPVIHVLDLSDPTAPRELAPLLATSVVSPARRVAVKGLAISPPTRDYRRYLYAIDRSDPSNASLMVYDVTDPVSSPRTPLLRPHAELNPFVAPDRLSFSSDVATVAFVQHDWPVQSTQDPNHQYSGVLCNPNPNAHPDANTFNDRGAYYRADQAGVIQSSGSVQGFPGRLRGVFAFATLSNGNVVAIDVDDWDAPCRRPDPMDVGFLTGSLDVPQRAPVAGDLDPYHAPRTYQSSIAESAAVTLEAYFPVSAPNRLRSEFLLDNDPSSGIHIPNLVGLPQLFDVNGAPISTTGTGAVGSPLMLPTPLPGGFVDPTYESNPTEPNPDNRVASNPKLVSATGQGGALLPGSTDTSPAGVRISFDDPTSQIDQDWTVTYEGALPTVSGIAADITSTQPLSSPDDAYQTLTLTAPGAAFCARGIEDWNIGAARAKAATQAMRDGGLPAPGSDALGIKNPSPALPELPQWTSDYVEITDDLLPSTDGYWSESVAVNACWAGLSGLDDDSNASVASNRYSACQQAFDASFDADTHLARDLPIVHAFDDHLEVGRFGWVPQDANNNNVPETTTNRVVVGKDRSNKPFLQFVQCCFHHQAGFKVRAGGEWLTSGANGIGLLHHVRADASNNNACVLSCDPSQALLNARAFDVPWSTPAETGGSCVPRPLPGGLDRNSPLAMRNPMFSFIVWSGCGVQPNFGDHTLTTRDSQWRFSVRGGFNPVTVALTQNTTTAVSPQSMRFIDSLGQLAVVDGSAQGLVLIDLNTVSFAHNPYF